MSDEHGHNDADQQAPDRYTAGNVATTGHSDHDVQAAGAHAAHGDVDATAEVSTLVPTTWRQLILPLLILLLVAVLLAGPIAGAFSPTPPTPPPTNEQREGGGTNNQAAAEPTQPALSTPTEVAVLMVAPTDTPLPPPSATAPPSPTADQRPDDKAIATQTAVALLGEQGIASRAPVRLVFGTAEYQVEAGSGLLPDWKPPAQENLATWIQGTYANHIIYLPYSDANAALFSAARPGDVVKLVMDSGQTFEFAVTRSERAANGPPASNEQFTVTAAMDQDHAGVTLFLVGDPAPDRAVVQADFTGNIQ
jgi:hypothetical protein